MRKFIVFLCVLCCSVAHGEQGDENNTFTYRPLYEKQGYIIIDEGKGSIDINGRKEDAEFCGSAEKRVCFCSAKLAFFVTEEVLRNADEWEYCGAKFRVIQSFRRRAFGMSFVLYTIQAQYPNNEYSYLYLFDKKFGIVSISIVDKIRQSAPDMPLLHTLMFDVLVPSSKGYGKLEAGEDR